MRRGFVLLEVLISSLIAALISTGLLTMIFQVNRLRETVDTITSMYGRVAILKNQLERDVMGAFIPTQVDLIQTSTDKRLQKGKPIEKVFYGMNKDEHLDLLTFITSNPLQMYFGIKDSKLKPRAARVVYRLVPDERIKNSYVLMRQEGTKSLAFDAYKKDAQGDMRSYAMIDGIQSLSVQYVQVEQKSTDEKKKSIKRIYKKQKSWDSKKKQDEKQKKKEPIQLPNQIEVQIELWDSTYKSHRPFSLTIPIMAMSSEFKQLPDAKKKEGEKKKDSKNSKSVKTVPAKVTEPDKVVLKSVTIETVPFKTVPVETVMLGK